MLVFDFFASFASEKVEFLYQKKKQEIRIDVKVLELSKKEIVCERKARECTKG